MNQRTAFFDALTEELPDDVWGLRLQQELSAHLEDAVYFSALEGRSETIAEEQALADLGSPTLILQEFRHAMTYKSPQAFVLHAIGVGLLASPIVFVATAFLIIAAPVSVPFYAILIAMYVNTLAPIFRHIESKNMAQGVMAIVTGIPLLIVTVPFIYSITTAFDSFVSASDKPFLIATSGLAGVITVVSGWIAMRYLLKKIPATKAKEEVTTKTAAAFRFGAIVFIAFTILSTIAQHEPGIRYLQGFSDTRWLVDTIFTVPNTLSDVVPSVTTVWITGIIFCGATLVGLYFVILALRDRMKKIPTPFPWIWLAITVYTVTLVVFPPTTPSLSVAWSSLPVARISARIERQEFGPLYSTAKYLNQDSPHVFSYHLSNPPLTNVFEIQQYPNRIYTISNITSVDAYDIALRNEDTISYSASWSTEGVWCHWVDHPGIMTSEPPMVTGQKVFLETLSPMFCSDLYVGDRKIFDAPQGIDIGRDASVAVSADKNWLLFAHDVDNEIRGSFTPTEVYLIDLR